MGFSGHRRLANAESVRAEIGRVLDQLAERVEAPLAAVSSVASGADMLFAAAAAERMLPWTALLPLPRADFARDFTTAEWSEAERLLAGAATVEEEPASDDREEAYLECGIRTVDACDVLVAVWDGRPAAGKGGTGDVVAHARRTSVPVIWIHAETGAVVWERIEALPRPDGAGPQAERPTGTDGGLAAVAALRDHHDTLASHHAPEARELLTKVILLHLVATALALLGPILGLWFAIALGLVGLKIGLLIYADRLHHRRQHSQEVWLRSRIVAELARAMVGAWSVPHAERVHRAVPVPGFARWQRTLALWHRWAAPAELPLAEAKARYARDRVNDQLGYFRKHLQRAQQRHDRAHRLATFATWGAITCGLAVLAVQLPHLWQMLQGVVDDGDGTHPKWEKVIKWLSLVLPLVSAAILSWSAANDHGRRVVRNQEMVALLERAAGRLERVSTWGGLERTAAEVEQVLLLEILEWHSVSRFGGDAH